MPNLSLGDGSDGDITISSNAILQSTLITGGRSYADGVCYRVTSLSSSSATVTATPNGIVAGDELIIINVRSRTRTGNDDNVGNYEFIGVESIDGNTINFSSTKVNDYGDSGGDVNVSTHYVYVQRVPNYNNLTLNNGITLDSIAHTSNSSGVCVMKAKETMTIEGTINNDSDGAPVGSLGDGWNIGYGNGVGGTYQAGAGASYGTVGEIGSGDLILQPGVTYGSADMAGKLHIGSSGGSGYRAGSGQRKGGLGGGTVFLMAMTLNISGIIDADGGKGQPTDNNYRYAGGSGSGGSILLHAGELIISGTDNIRANGGTRTYNTSVAGYGGAGGKGRIATFYATGNESAIAQATNPDSYTGEITMPYGISGIIAGADGSVRITLHDKDSAQLLGTTSGTNGAYEMTTPGTGPYDVIAKDVNGEIISYGNVTAYEV